VYGEVALAPAVILAIIGLAPTFAMVAMPNGMTLAGGSLTPAVAAGVESWLWSIGHCLGPKVEWA